MPESRNSSERRVHAARRRAVEGLLAQRGAAGHWVGELSHSALSTATAVIALSLVERESGVRLPGPVLREGLDWLAQHGNADGGWGDTVLSVSNISTTALAWAAFGAVHGADMHYEGAVSRAERWIEDRIGAAPSALRANPEPLADAVIARYGEDRTFSVPILTACALAGRLGHGRAAWRRVIPLPFELAACPHRWFAALRMPVVSYALPALIAIGLARHVHRPSRNPLLRLLRGLVRGRALKVLERIQPRNGGFLEATPLTSFVVMSLAGSGLASHSVVARGTEFLLESQRADGSWPIDTNLATWLTTLAVNALGEEGISDDHADHTELQSQAPLDSVRSSLPHSASVRAEGRSDDGLEGRGLTRAERRHIRTWLLGQQHRCEHPFTHAAPGGWAWTDLPGGVPDADDTAGALLALWHLSRGESDAVRAEAGKAARAGIGWLLGLQNRDGGIPTFCRGWGRLPFDRSSADLTAHALRAWIAWLPELEGGSRVRTEAAVARALAYLERTQRADGAWLPLWFGNQHAPQDENPLYGTARVVRALTEARGRWPQAEILLHRGVAWLLEAQSDDGGWGGAAGVPVSVEETALALECLARVLGTGASSSFTAACQAAVKRGALWLVGRIESGAWTHPAPIGFYFARLWYYEKLYPQIFAVAALNQVTGAEPAQK